MNKLAKRLAAVCLIAIASIGTQSAHAVSADTTIEIDFPTIIVLYHFDTINLDVSQADLATALGATSSGCTSAADPGEFCFEVTPSPSGLAWDLTTTPVDAGMDAADPDDLTPLADVDVTIENAWGVRSIGATTLSASVAVPVAGLTNGIDTLAVTVVGSGTTNTSPTPGLGLVTLETGDITFNLDMTTLTTDGTYAGDFRITIETP